MGNERIGTREETEARSMTPTTPPATKGVTEALRDFANWCDEQGAKLGAVDGYGYHSGEEAAYRHASIEATKRALASLSLPPPGEGETDDTYPDPSDLASVNKALREQISELCATVEALSTPATPELAVKALTIDEVERIILATEPAELSDRADKIWTRRMAVALAGLFNGRLALSSVREP